MSLLGRIYICSTNRQIRLLVPKRQCLAYFRTVTEVAHPELENEVRTPDVNETSDPSKGLNSKIHANSGDRKHKFLIDINKGPTLKDFIINPDRHDNRQDVHSSFVPYLLNTCMDDRRRGKRTSLLLERRVQ